jgi:tetratricopeptide (TPR) repeat protein
MTKSSETAVRARQYYQQGLAFHDRGQWPEAVEALRLVLMTAPEHLEARLRLVTILLQRNKGEQGLRILESGLARRGMSNPNRIRLLEKASACAAVINQYPLARDYLERALEIGDLPSPELLNKIAKNCCKAGEFQAGFDYFLQASKTNPSSEL